MSDVSLSAAVRNSLLSLQGTTKLIETTQGRLSSGLKVSSPIDDPVSFFQAKALTDRADDFTEKKGTIDQGISTLTAALDGVNSIESLVRQLKGIANNLKSADSTQLSDLVSQFNDLRTQIDNLANDASYQGTNLVAATGVTLDVEFSDKSASLVTVSSFDLRVGTSGLSIASAAAYTGNFIVDYASAGTGSLSTSSDTAQASYGSTAALSLTWQGANKTYTAGSNATLTYGTQSVTITFVDEQVINKGDVISVDLVSAGGSLTAGIYTDSTTKIATADVLTYNTATAGVAAGTDFFLITWDGSAQTFSAGELLTFGYGANGSQTVILQASADVALTTSGTFQVGVLTAGATGGFTGDFFIAPTTALVETTSAVSYVEDVAGISLTATVDANTTAASYVGVGDTTSVNAVIAELDTALSTLRSNSSTLGGNVALLQTRLDFTDTYVNTLEQGGAKLTLADLNEEGANLLALQTRQQLGIQALSFAGQAEQSILALFR